MNRSALRFPERRFFAGIAVGVLVGVLGVGAVTAAGPTPSVSTAVGATGTAGSPATSGSPAASEGTAVKAGRRLAGVKLGALRKAIAGNFRVAVTATNRKGTHDILYVRGSLAVSTTAVTVTLPDNSTQSFTVDSTTVVRDSGAKVAFSDLANGERAVVFGTKNSDGSYTAKLIRSFKDATAAAAGPTGSAAP